MRRLSLRYPNGMLALRGVDLDVQAGEFLVVLGGNGCGKTTLLRCVTRALTPTEGQVWVDGEDMIQVAGAGLRRLRQRIAMVWQQPSLVRRRSVVTNVACGALARNNTLWTNLGGLPAATLPEALACLGQVALAHLADRRAGTLSGGQAQRVAIARALMQRPAVLLADEPVASLDPEAAHDIMRLLKQLAHQQNLAVLCVLHQVDLALAYADRIVGMRDGMVVLDQPRSELSIDTIQPLYLQRVA